LNEERVVVMEEFLARIQEMGLKAQENLEEKKQEE